MRKCSATVSTHTSENRIKVTCAKMLYFLVILLWIVVERFVAGVGVSSNRTGLMEFAFGRVSDTWDVPVFTVATRNITTQHLFQVETSILGKPKSSKLNQKIENKKSRNAPRKSASALCREDEVWALSNNDPILKLNIMEKDSYLKKRGSKLGREGVPMLWGSERNLTGGSHSVCACLWVST